MSAVLAHPFFLAKPPKSLDRNDFSGTAVESLATDDAAATLTAFTAASIAGVLPLLPSRPSLAIVCGGGARNKTLMWELADRLPCPVVLAKTFRWPISRRGGRSNPSFRRNRDYHPSMRYQRN